MPRVNARPTNKAKKVIKKKIDLARIEYLAAAARKFIRETTKLAKKRTTAASVKKRISKKIKVAPKKKVVPKKRDVPRKKAVHKVDAKAASHALDSLGVVDPESNIEGDIFRLDDNPADVMLAFVDPAKNVDKFFILQIITRTNNYVVYTRWGRTGSVGQTLHQNFDKVEDAIKCFEAKFEEKTGLTWENRGNPMIGDKYRYIKQNFSDKRNRYEGAKWQYWVDDGVDGKADGWYDYTATGSTQVEQLYQEHILNGNLSNRLVESGYFAYSVNLIQMTQTNMKHANRTTRRIRRVPK